MVTTSPREVEAFAVRHPERVQKAESIKCPRRTCRAEIGKRCRTPSGVVTWWHTVRRKESGAADRLGNWI